MTLNRKQDRTKDSTGLRKVSFIVNEVPRQVNRTRYQHAKALTDSFETEIISKGEVPPEILADASQHTCFDDHWASTLSVLFPIWLFYSVLRAECSIVVTGPNSLYLIAGRLASVLRGRIWVADIWDDPSLTLDSFRTTEGAKRNPRYLYHLILFHLARISISGVDLVITSIHPGVLEKYDIDERSVVKLTNGVCEEFLTESLSNTTNEELRIVYVGQVNSKRAIETYVDSLATLDVDRKVVVDLVGPIDDEVKHRLAAHAGAVSFDAHGLVQHETALRIVEDADICLCILPEDVENYQYSYPIKLLEYAALGKPIIASNFTGIREILTNGVSGIMVDPTDSQSVVDSVKMLCDDEELRRNLGENAQETAEKYIWSDITDSYVRAINKYIEQPQGTHLATTSNLISDNASDRER